MKKIEIFEIIIYILAILLFLIMEFIWSPGGFIFLLAIPVVLIIVGFYSNKARKSAKTIFSKSIFYSIEISTLILTMIFIIFTLFTIFVKGDWRMGWQFIFFPIYAIIVESIGLLIGIFIAFILKNKYKVESNNIESKKGINIWIWILIGVLLIVFFIIWYFLFW